MNHTEISAANMKALDAEQGSLCERRFYHVGFLADLMAEYALSLPEPFYKSDDFREYYQRIRFDQLRAVSTEGALDVSRETIGNTGKEMSLALRVSLCRVLAERLMSENPAATLTSSHETTSEVVSYLHNSYADSAYLRFSQFMSDPSVAYAESFDKVCESVYYRRTGFAVLPISNTSEGTLGRFRQLIQKYGLKTVMTCDIPMSDGDNSTRFALLRKDIEVLPCPVQNSEAFFELMVPLRDSSVSARTTAGIIGEKNEKHAKKQASKETVVISNPGQSPEFSYPEATVADILSAAECFGLAVVGVNTVRSSYTEDKPFCEIRLSIGTGDIRSFICFLQLEAPEFIPLGIYSHIF